MDSERRLAKEAWVSNGKGCTTLDIHLLLWTCIAAYACWRVMPVMPWASLLQDVFLLLAMMTASLYPHLTQSLLLLLTAIPLMLPAMSKPKDPAPLRNPVFTLFRGIMMLLTIHAILAVDFRVFPKGFMKTETYGVSLMDLGVGAVVFASYLTRSRVGALGLRVLSVVLLGAIRTASTLGVNYQVHVSEYGVHWNFFITLAVVEGVVGLCWKLARGRRMGLLGLVVLLLYQYGLELGGTEYVLNAPRTSLFSANKEGIFSSVGYVSLGLMSLSLGRQLKRDWPQCVQFLAMVSLGSGGAVWAFDWAGIAVSRRMANAPYVLWVIHICSTALALLYLVYYGLKGRRVPLTMEAINRSMLPSFLIANLGTGLVNLSMDTLAVSEPWALVILSTYMLSVTTIAILLYSRNWVLKL